MSTELVEHQSKNVNSLLQPLRYGQPVALKVSDPKTPRKKRIGKPVLFITPTSLYGLEPDALVFALQGQGCEVMRKDDIRSMYLIRIGLSFRAAKLLTTELNRIFNQEENKNG